VTFFFWPNHIPVIWPFFIDFSHKNVANDLVICYIFKLEEFVLKFY